jgi:hypothetical protein
MVMSIRKRSRIMLALGIVAIVLALALLYVPTLVRVTINDSLKTMPDGYRGVVEDIEIHPLRPGLDLVGLRIEKRDGSIKLPYLRMERLAVRVVEGTDTWPELELRFVKPQANLVDAPTKAGQQWGPSIDLADLKEQLTLQLRRVIVEDGQVHLRHFSADPPIDVYASHLNVMFDNVTDCLPPSTTCNATLEARAHGMAQALITASGTLVHDETGRIAKDESWRFDVRGRVNDLRLPTVNPALVHYAKLDVQRGRGTVLAALHLHDKHLFGHVRPVLEDMDVVGKKDEDSKLFRELAAGLAAHFVEKRDGRVVLHFDKRGEGKLKTRLEIEDEAPRGVKNDAPNDNDDSAARADDGAQAKSSKDAKSEQTESKGDSPSRNKGEERAPVSGRGRRGETERRDTVGRVSDERE